MLVTLLCMTASSHVETPRPDYDFKAIAILLQSWIHIRNVVNNNGTLLLIKNILDSLWNSFTHSCM